MQRLFAHDRTCYPQLVFAASEVATSGGGRDFFEVDQAHTVGMFYWGGIDYLGESFGWPNKGWFRGFVDTCGFRKPVSWYVQSLYSDRPLVRIAVQDPRPGSDVVWNDVKLSWRPYESHWNWEPGRSVRLATYTNCESVELMLNGRSLGVRKLADCRERLMEWDVPFEPGRLQAVARAGDATVATHELRTAGTPERIALQSDRPFLRADGQDLAHVTVLVTDREGVAVPAAANRVRFAVSGAGRSAGVDNGDLVSGESFQAGERSVVKGRGLLVVRAGRRPGPIVVEATSPGLSGGRLELLATGGD
jgi:beta-galactosidase